MRVEFLNAKQVGKKLKKLMSSTEEFYWAVAWATNMDFAKKLFDNHNKIKKFIVGIDFAQTSDKFLETLQPVENVRYMPSNGNSTFHPKIYCFVKDEKVYAIVGSSNLTKGGTDKNEEASVFLEGTLEDEPLQEILDAVSSWWNASNEIDDDFLANYERIVQQKKEKNSFISTIADFNVKNPSRIHIAWWIENIDKNNYSKEVLQDSNFLDEMTFLKDDDIQEGDWILSWKCKEDGSPDESVRMNWMYVDEVIKEGYFDGSDYTKVAVQIEQNDFLIPFELDSKVELIIKKLLESNEFKNAFSFNSENWHCPEQEEVKKFLNCVKREYENGRK
jgi:HKD family nuclease